MGAAWKYGRFRKGAYDWYESVKAWPGMEEQAEKWYPRAVQAENKAAKEEAYWRNK